MEETKKEYKIKWLGGVPPDGKLPERIVPRQDQKLKKRPCGGCSRKKPKTEPS